MFYSNWQNSGVSSSVQKIRYAFRIQTKKKTKNRETLLKQKMSVRLREPFGSVASQRLTRTERKRVLFAVPMPGPMTKVGVRSSSTLNFFFFFFRGLLCPVGVVMFSLEHHFSQQQKKYVVIFFCLLNFLPPPPSRF